MATMDPGQRAWSDPPRLDQPYVDPGPAWVEWLADVQRRRGATRGDLPRHQQIPPELLQMLMAQLMAGQGGGAQRRPPSGRPPMGGGRPPMGGGRPPMGRPPMGGGMPPMGRPPMGGPQRGGQRPPMGGGRPPVIKIEDLVRALSGGGGQRQAPQANMPVPQARR